jgi:hypothetical protein
MTLTVSFTSIFPFSGSGGPRCPFFQDKAVSGEAYPPTTHAAEQIENFHLE